MASIKACTKAFVDGKVSRTHNSFTDGTTYFLHGHAIARRPGGHGCPIIFDWCKHYTPTTANHMNHILKAAGAHFRVSATKDDAAGIKVFEYNPGAAC
jgi:hypothetical protein